MKYWQLCPKCNGSGTLWGFYGSTTSTICDVCNGKKIIETPDTCSPAPYIIPYIPIPTWPPYTPFICDPPPNGTTTIKWNDEGHGTVTIVPCNPNTVSCITGEITTFVDGSKWMKPEDEGKTWFYTYYHGNK